MKKSFLMNRPPAERHSLVEWHSVSEPDSDTGSGLVSKCDMVYSSSSVDK